MIPKRLFASQNGSLLVAVIWGIALIAVVVTITSSEIRLHTQVSSNEAANAVAANVSDIGVVAAGHVIMGSYSNGSATSWPLRYKCRFRDRVALLVSIYDEAGKIDLNIADTGLLRGLLIGIGFDQARAATLSHEIIDYRDEDDLPRRSGAEADEYQRAGIDRRPANRPFVAIEELESIRSISDTEYVRIRPFVTVHSGLNGIDPKAAEPSILLALSRGLSGASGPAIAPSVDSDKVLTLPTRYAHVSPRRHFKLKLAVKSTAGGSARREAIVQLRPGRRPLLRVVAWNADITEPQGDGTGDNAEYARASASTGQSRLPPCGSVIQ